MPDFVLVDLFKDLGGTFVAKTAKDCAAGAVLMLAFAAVIALWVILSPLVKPGVPVNAKSESTIIDVSQFEEGTVDVIEWFDKPLLLARRSAETEALLRDAVAATLRDPYNEKSIQPESADNAVRSVSPGWFVAIGIGTSSGCALNSRPYRRTSAASPTPTCVGSA